MKRIILKLLGVLLLSLPCMAQLRLGAKGGISTSSLHFDSKMLSSERRIGWTAGLQLELRLPIVGLGIDGSLMFTHRNDVLQGDSRTYHRDYIEIPVHLRYTLSIIGLNKLVAPFAFTGPNFGLLCHESDNITWDNRASNLSWDAGFGVELLNHVQISASYSLGLTKAFKQVGIDRNNESITGRDRCWTLTAAYLF